MWRDEEVKCVHYVLDKPWMERPSWDSEAAEAVKVTHSWWWEAKEKLERRIKRDDCKVLWELPVRYVLRETYHPTPPGTATPRTLLPFSNTQSVEPPVVRFAKRDFVHDWVCSTHVIQAASPRESPAVKTSTVLTTKPLPVESTKAERQAAVDMKYAQIMEQRNAIAAGVKSHLMRLQCGLPLIAMPQPGCLAIAQESH
ncbi:hypothetical protein RhiJN_12862 [Ceratobasidium sp. AG-Ba]|nr:hypothetical protein RhiJN_12862 [Ceratobasidium sp. AG-Ba]